MARKIKSHEARRRQMQYIGRLMREMDTGLVEMALEKISAGEAEKKRRFKLVERWRDELVDGNDHRLKWLIEEYPSIDPHELGRLVDSAQSKHPGLNSKKAGRMLFRYLSQQIFA
jgi:ribosome-associated protein